jgi:hypothetical protein
MNNPGEQFAALLADLRSSGDSDEDLTQRLRASILRVGSETEDNINCVNHLEVGTVSPLSKDPILRVRAERGVKLRHRPFLVSDVLQYLEGDAIPPTVLASFPDLTQGEWDACMRFVTHVLLTLKRR